MATFTSLINQTIRRLAMVGGTGTQLYSEDLIGDMVQHTFDLVFDETDWPQFTFWNTYTLDGTLGVVTADLTNVVKRFDDVLAIFPTNSNTQVTEFSATSNPNLLSGTTPIHYSRYASADKVFHVWPKTATGTVELYGRTKPDDFTGTDTVDFDSQCLVLGACYDFLEDDGSNPGAAEKFRNLFENRLRQLKKLRSNAPISLDPVTDRVQQFSFTELP